MGFESMPSHDKPPQTAEEIKEVESHMDPIQRAQSKAREKAIGENIPTIAKAAERLKMSLAEVEQAGIKVRSLSKKEGYTGAMVHQWEMSAKNLRGKEINLIVSQDVVDGLATDRLAVKGTLNGKELSEENAKLVYVKYIDLFRAIKQDSNAKCLDPSEFIMDYANKRDRQIDAVYAQDEQLQDLKDLLG